MYQIENDKILKKPEMRIGDRIFEIDNRLSVFREITKQLDGQGDEFEAVIAGALGRAAFEEILDMDLSFGVMQDIVIIILAAIQDLSQEEAARRFRKPSKSGAGLV